MVEVTGSPDVDVIVNRSQGKLAINLVKERIQELTRALPELRDILANMVDAGIQAQKA